MHSIAMPSSPAFLTISYFIASPNPCCPFLPLSPLQSPLKKTRCPDATISEVPSLLVSRSPITSQPFAAQGLSRVSMRPTPLTPLTAAVRTLNVPNVSSSSRDLALAALCFMRATFLSARLPRRFFRANAFRLSLNSMSRCFLSRLLPSFFRHVGCGTHHVSTPTSSTLLLTRVCPPSITPLLGSGPTFTAAAMSQLCYRRHDCRGKRFRFVGVHHRQSMLLAGCTVAVDEFSHQSMQ